MNATISTLVIAVSVRVTWSRYFYVSASPPSHTSPPTHPNKLYSEDSLEGAIYHHHPMSQNFVWQVPVPPVAFGRHLFCQSSKMSAAYPDPLSFLEGLATCAQFPSLSEAAVPRKSAGSLPKKGNQRISTQHKYFEVVHKYGQRHEIKLELQTAPSVFFLAVKS